MTGAPKAASGRRGAVSPASLTVDVVIDNHNYERYLADAVDSALGQTHPLVNVIAVDDGSTDGSRRVLTRYDGKLEVVLKENGGQASALNAGAARAFGDILIFLDSDDVLHPKAAARFAAAFAENPAAVKVQSRMEVIDALGHASGVVKPASHLTLPAGDLRRSELTFPFDLVWMPNGATAFRTAALRRILPIPEHAFRDCPDWYLVHLTALLGNVVSLPEVGAYYRVHGRNRYERSGSQLELRHIRQAVTYSTETRRALEQLAGELGIALPHRRILSVADLAYRLISLKLEPDLHPVSADRVLRLALDGMRAARRRFDVSWSLRGVFACWFVAMAVAPRRMAHLLAVAFVAERPQVAAALLRWLHTSNRDDLARGGSRTWPRR
jgi:glycosyltransferase involved in cell wall biosynthesis